MLHIEYWGKLLFKTGELKSKRNSTTPIRVVMFEIQDSFFSATQTDPGNML